MEGAIAGVDKRFLSLPEFLQTFLIVLRASPSQPG
jgi:hypothetical protein